MQPRRPANEAFNRNALHRVRSDRFAELTIDSNASAMPQCSFAIVHAVFLSFGIEN
jgi:hypothetical protein